MGAFLSFKGGQCVAQSYSQETKAAALAEVATGASVNATAKKYGIGRATLTNWRDAAGLSVQTLTPAGQQKKAELGEQLYDYLTESIATMVAQLRFARTPEWLARQNAADLAVFMGVTADKATRLLAAFRPSPDADTPPVIDIPAE